jgi:hypothetical protein
MIWLPGCTSRVYENTSQSTITAEIKKSTIGFGIDLSRESSLLRKITKTQFLITIRLNENMRDIEVSTLLQTIELYMKRSKKEIVQ